MDLGPRRLAGELIRNGWKGSATRVFLRSGEALQG